MTDALWAGGRGGDSWLLSKKENKEPQEHSGLSIPFTPVTHTTNLI